MSKMKALLLFLILLKTSDCTNETDLCRICKCNYSNIPRNLSLFIDCSDMNINEMPEEIRMPSSVDVLDLSKNKLDSASIGARSLKTVRIAELRLQSNDIGKIFENDFDHIMNLEVLNLSFNYIADIIGIPFQSLKQLKILDLSGNHLREIPENVFRYLPELIELSLAKNPLHTLGWNTFNRLPSLTRLDLSDTALSSIHREVFRDCPSLQYLDLSGNNFQEVPTRAFQNTDKLRHLKLSGNPITILERKSFWFPESLSELELDNMPVLFEVRAFAFSRLKALVSVRISGNKVLSTFDGKALEEVETLEKLDLSKNRLYTVHNGESLGNMCSHLEVDLDENPWNCDCKLKWMQKCSRKSNSSFPTCWSPSSMRGNRIEKLDPDKLTCEDTFWIAGLGRMEKKVGVILISLGTLGILASVCGIILMIKYKPRITLNRRAKDKNSDLYYVRMEDAKDEAKPN